MYVLCLLPRFSIQAQSFFELLPSSSLRSRATTHGPIFLHVSHRTFCILPPRSLFRAVFKSRITFVVRLLILTILLFLFLVFFAIVIRLVLLFGDGLARLLGSGSSVPQVCALGSRLFWLECSLDRVR
jgi:hypothetical protein